MSKRFTDTDKYKKPFIRGLQGAYKLFWDYLYHDCDHAGIWIVDFDIAQIYLGKDMIVNKEDSLKYFNSDEIRIIEIDNGKKWFIPSFIKFQYGELSPENRAHNSVIRILKEQKLFDDIKGLTRPLQGCKDKDKEKDTDKVKDKDKMTESHFEKFWQTYPKKEGKKPTRIKFLKLDVELFETIMYALEWQTQSKKWQEGFIPNPETYINQERWNDEKPNILNNNNGHKPEQTNYVYKLPTDYK